MPNCTKTTLDEVGEWGSGGTPLSSKPEYYGGSIPWLIIEDLNDDYIFSSQRTITHAGLKNSSAKLLQPNTLLIAMYGSIGKLGITGVSCSTNQAIAFCKPDPKQADIRFLFYYLLYSRPKLNVEGRGGTQQNISQAILKEFPIALPRVEEQKRIAAILDKADRLRRTRRYAQQLSDTFLQSVFVEMFRDIDSRHQQVLQSTVDEVAKRVVVGHVGQTLEGYCSSGIPFLRTQNVRRLHINRNDMRYITPEFNRMLKKSKLCAGDVLVSRVGANRGMAAVVPDDLNDANCANVLIVTPNEQIVSEYLAFLINSPLGQRELLGVSVGSAQGVINTTSLQEWRITVPPLPLQERFARIIQRFERLRAQQREAARQAEHLFQTLLHRAFRGEL
jgi:type I restriction enzyme, S subunit